MQHLLQCAAIFIQVRQSKGLEGPLLTQSILFRKVEIHSMIEGRGGQPLQLLGWQRYGISFRILDEVNVFIGQSERELIFERECDLEETSHVAGKLDAIEGLELVYLVDDLPQGGVGY